MHQTKRRILAKLLAMATDLKTADELIEDSFTPTLSKSMRWGVWDGYTGRPWTTGGLIPEHAAQQPDMIAVRDSYDQGYQVGKQIARESRP